MQLSPWLLDTRIFTPFYRRNTDRYLKGRDLEIVVIGRLGGGHISNRGCSSVGRRIWNRLCVSLVKAAHTPFRSVALLPRNVRGFQAGRGFHIKARGGILV